MGDDVVVQAGAVGAGDDDALNVAVRESRLEETAVKLLLAVQNVDAREAVELPDVKRLFDCWSAFEI